VVYGGAMAEDRQVRHLDARGLKALAHPLRVRMLGTLRNDGPATATQLAQRLGESTGTTSWHLRQLADNGFIEEDPDRGTRRDRWWRARDRASQLSVRDFADQPELMSTIGVYLLSVLELDFARAADFLAGVDGWPPDWRDAVTFSDFSVRTDAAGLTRLNEELFEVLARHQARAVPEGAEPVHVQIQSFPRGGAS
jgi:DNA-binding transcriptional ArsR family regulator